MRFVWNRSRPRGGSRHLHLRGLFQNRQWLIFLLGQRHPNLGDVNRGLGDVLPILPHNNVVNTPRADAKHPSEAVLAVISSCEPLANFYHFFRSQLGNWVFLAGRASVAASSLVLHVPHVVGLGSKEKMCRVYARRVVASVTNKQSFRNRPVVYQPRCAMRANRVFSSDSLRNVAVTSGCFTTNPQPAPVAFLDLFPEPIREGFRKFLRGEIFGGKRWLHSKLVLLCRALGCFSIAEVFSCPQFSLAHTAKSSP